jgi:MFS family permease
VLKALADRFGAALAYSDFRALWTANAFAQAAAWGLIVTRGWLIYRETESSFLVGVATFAALGPQFIVPPIIGVLADRMDRRTILAWTYAVNSAQTGLLAVLALVGALEIWMLIVLSVVNGVARSAQMPTAQAFSASLVPREKLLNALSLQASTQHGSRLVGRLPGLRRVLPLRLGQDHGDHATTARTHNPGELLQELRRRPDLRIQPAGDPVHPRAGLFPLRFDDGL